MVLKILHISDDPLPDWRVEKSALTLKKDNNMVFFAGKEPSSNYYRKTFDKIFTLNWTPKARYQIPYDWYKIKRQINDILLEVQPDIIHAHNILSARLIQEIKEYPFVYDNHEYWSKYLLISNEKSAESKLQKGFNPKNVFKSNMEKLLKKASTKRWINWELDLVSKIPTLVPSKPIANELLKIGKKIYVLPNFPMKNENYNICDPKMIDHFSSVYAGTMPYKGYQTPFKNIDGFIPLFKKFDIGTLNIIGWKSENSKNVIYHGLLDRDKMLDEMSNNSIGLIPFIQHPFHQYMSPNKAYEYAHAGLLILSTNSIKPIFDELKDNVIGFNDYDELIENLKYFKTMPEELLNRRTKTSDYAKKYIIWERHEQSIYESYKQA
ncbi:MAG TPA: hypothetical protein VIY08_13205 [Candidatus Nitrosocosmicus sp.]